MKSCFITKEKAAEIAAKYPTPFYVYDEKGIENNLKDVLSAFSWNKGFKEFFAVKATPNPILLKLLKKIGCGVDCSSLTELMMAEKLGFTGEEIMFSSNETAAEEYVLAKKLGAFINLDDITHIEFLKEVAGIPERICMRYNPGGEFNLNNRIMGTPADAKYGMTRTQLSEAVKTLMSEGVKEFGLHSFLASNTLGNEYYPELAKVLFQTVKELQEETGAKFVFINLSGGVGIPYRPDQESMREIDLVHVRHDHRGVERGHLAGRGRFHREVADNTADILGRGPVDPHLVMEKGRCVRYLRRLGCGFVHPDGAQHRVMVVLQHFEAQ